MTARTTTAADPADAPAPPPDAGLPAEARARLNGELAGQVVIAWAEYDLDEGNRYDRRYAVLTEAKLLLIDGAASPRAFAVGSIQEAKIVEGLGVDRLTVVADGAAVATVRYTRRFRREMARLHRKLERRLTVPSGEARERAPEWLEVAEREAEAKEHCPKCGQLIPAYAEGVCPRCLARRKILWRLLDVARPYRSRVWLSLFLTTVVSLLGVLPGAIQKQLVDKAIDPKAYDVTGRAFSVEVSAHDRIVGLLAWSALLLVTVLIAEWLNGWQRRVLALLSTRVTADLRHNVYAHLHELSLRYFGKRRTGSLITRVTNDTDRIWDFIVFGSIDLVRDVVMVVGIATAMFLMNWRLAALSLIPLPLLGYLTYHRGMKMQALWGRLWTYWSRMTAVVGDSLPGVRVVKAFANERREVDRFDRRSEEYAAKEQEVHKIWTTLQPIVSGLMRVGALVVWVAGGYMIIRSGGAHGYTLGVLVAFNGYVWQFYGPIMELANSNRMVTRAATSAQRIFEVLDTPPEIYSRSGAVTKDRLDGRVEFRQASFSYEGAQPALREVTMLAEPGQMIGLCGSSGAGKSTFVNLITRFYDVTDGQILIDGVDLRDYDVKWLRRQVGVVLQEPYLFHGTIAENIRYGNPDATDEQVITAARAANAHDFIVNLPDGYDTMVGERGQSLSGGERQRVSIARAILHNPRILILDEATSSVDTETERQIQQALDHLVHGRTTFAIAHRLTTLAAADKLIVLEKGRVAEQGTHDELIAKPGGIYAKLHQTQLDMQQHVTFA